jgi:hypothetical protein
VEEIKLKLNRLYLRLELAKWRDDEFEAGNRLKAIKIQRVINRHFERFGK